MMGQNQRSVNLDTNSKVFIWTKKRTKIFLTLLHYFFDWTSFYRPGQRYKNIFVRFLVQMKICFFSSDVLKYFLKKFKILLIKTHCQRSPITKLTCTATYCLIGLNFLLVFILSGPDISKLKDWQNNWMQNGS